MLSDEATQILDAARRVLAGAPAGQVPAGSSERSIATAFARSATPEGVVVEQRFARLDADGRWHDVAGPADLVERSSALQPHAAGCALAALRNRP